MCRRDGRPSPACWRRRHLAAAHMGLAEQRHWGLKPPRKGVGAQPPGASPLTTRLGGVGVREAGALPRAGGARTLAAVTRRYALAITPEMLQLIDRHDPNDPIARQFVPSLRELKVEPGEAADPLAEARLSPVPGIVHRYGDRLLLKLTHVCPVYCRFCFRREVVGPGGPRALSGSALDAAFGYIARERAIWEVILTGGDPLMLAPRRINEVS